MPSNSDYDSECFTAFEVEKPSVLSVGNYLTTRYGYGAYQWLTINYKIAVLSQR